MEETLALYKRFEAETGDPVAASNLTLAHAVLQQHERLQERALTVEEAARRLKVSEKKVYRLCKDGTIPHHRVGAAIRIRPEDLDALSQPEETGHRHRRQTKWV